jgi:DNA modification methylase
MPLRSNAIETATVKLSQIRPSKRRLREHSRQQRRNIARLCKMAGGQFIRLVVTPDFEIIDGHALYDYLLESGAEEALVTILHAPDPTDVRALRLAVNRVVEDARWNNPNLKLEFLDLQSIGYDLDRTLFNPAEIEDILKLDIAANTFGENPEHLPPLEERTVADPGDIYSLGDHRLGCGDARDKDFVESVCQSARADVCIIDPPHNIPINRFPTGKKHHRHRDFVVGSGEPASEKLFGLLRDSLEVLRTSSSPRALVYIFMDWRGILELTAAGRSLNLPLNDICVWVKSNPAKGAPYRGQHELCAVFKAGDQPHRDNVALGRLGRNRSNVWDHRGMTAFGTDSDEFLKAHPNCKPVLMLADILRDVTKRGDMVLDTFCGWGSTIIAAEGAGRRCCATELDPRYVDAAIRRWQRTTGREAINLGTGQPFDDCSPHRLPFNAER